MPQPTVQQVHIDRFLTNMAIRYAQDADVFIADKVFPVIPVLKASDYYLKFPKGYFQRDEMKERAMGGRPPRAGYEIEKERYSCTEWSLEHTIDDRERENADIPIEPDLRGTELLTEQALIHRDKEWVEAFFKASVWSTEYEGVTGASSGTKFTKFSNYEAEGTTEYKSKPVRFFDEVATEMRKKTGRRPNKLVLGAKTYYILKNHPEVVERIKYTISPPAVVTPGILAGLFDVEEVLVAEAIYNTAAEGKTTSTAFIANETSWLMTYSAPAPSIQRPSAGYCFAWTGLIPGISNAFGGVLIRGREELAHTDVLQIRATYDMQQTASDLGIYGKTAV